MKLFQQSKTMRRTTTKKEKDCTDYELGDVLEQDINSENDNHRDEAESVIRNNPDLIEDDDDV